jgi:hypothetical protein
MFDILWSNQGFLHVSLQPLFYNRLEAIAKLLSQR